MKPGEIILEVQSRILVFAGGMMEGAICMILLFWIKREERVGITLSLESWRSNVPFWRRIEDVIS